MQAVTGLSALYSCALSAQDDEIIVALVDQMKPYYGIMDSSCASDKKIDLFGQYLSTRVKATQPTVTELDLAYLQLGDSAPRTVDEMLAAVKEVQTEWRAIKEFVLSLDERTFFQ